MTIKQTKHLAALESQLGIQRAILDAAKRQEYETKMNCKRAESAAWRARADALDAELQTEERLNKYVAVLQELERFRKNKNTK